MRQDDRHTEVTISWVVRPGYEPPAEGETITYIGQKQIGWKYDHDHRGYAIIHTAKPIEVQDDPRQYTVKKATTGIYAGAFDMVTITAYVIKTNIE